MKSGAKKKSQQESDVRLVTTSFRVETDLLDEFRTKARKNFRSPSWEIRRLMTEYIKEEAA
jgi:hypothetical protein